MEGNLLNKLLTFIFILSSPLWVQAQIWQENFDDLADGLTEDKGNTAWTTIAPAAAGHTFSKQSFPGYEILAVNDTGGEGHWISESINISTYSEVAIEITLGSYWASKTDYIRCYYKIDDGNEVLFGEQFGATNLNIAAIASAIVSGESLQIIIKASENTPGTYGAIPRIIGIDNIIVSSISYLYARNSGNWNLSGTWSSEGFGGPSCNCIPDENTHVFIGNNYNITLNGIAETAGLTVESLGRLNYAANGQLRIVRGGQLEVHPGGQISRNGNLGTTLTLATYSYNIHIDGDISVDNLVVNGANANFSGDGNIFVNNNLTVSNVVGKSFTNSLKGEFRIGNNLLFSSTSSNINFANRGNFSIGNSMRFDNQQVSFENFATLNINGAGLIVVAQTDQGNSFANYGNANLKNVNLNGADFSMINHGVIAQSGDYLNIGTQSRFENKEGSIWRFSGRGFNQRIFAHYPDNNFIYDGTGDQPVFVPAGGAYYNLKIAGAGIKTSSGNIEILNKFEISGSSQWDVSPTSYPLTVGGDFVVNSSHPDPLNGRTARISFVGNKDQSLEGSVTFAILEINKEDGTVFLTGDRNQTTVSQQLLLTKGGLDLNGHKLFINNSNSSAINRTYGFIKSEKDTAPYSAIVWALGTGSGEYTFPFGLSTGPDDYIPFKFDIKSPGAGSGNISVATYGTTNDNNLPFPEGVVNLGKEAGANVVNRFWQIDLDGFDTNPVADVTFTTAVAEATKFNILRAQRYNSVENEWDTPIANQANPTSNTVKVPMVSKFSPWTLVEESKPLPVELKYFKAALKSQGVIIEWATAQEYDNDFFTIEKADDLQNFIPVQFIPGKGNSHKENFYKAIDLFPLEGITYYRLKQTDFDGTSKYSKIVSIRKMDDVSPYLLSPNPTDGRHIQLKNNSLGAQFSDPVHIYNLQGKLVYSSKKTFSGALASISLQFEQPLPPGVYFIRIGEGFSQSFVVVDRE